VCVRIRSKLKWQTKKESILMLDMSLFVIIRIDRRW